MATEAGSVIVTVVFWVLLTWLFWPGAVALLAWIVWGAFKKEAKERRWQKDEKG